MATFSGKRVSRRWRTVLGAARRAGVGFTLNSGRRTMAEQTALFRQNMQFVGGRFVQRPGHPLTAFPSPNAPHIFAGRQGHAIDVDSISGGETRLEAWLEREGASVSNPVLGEPWHMVVGGRDLARLARRIKREQRAVRKAHEAEKEKKAARAALEAKARSGGAHFVGVILDEAQRADLPMALGFALIEQESGFRNVFGHDPTIFVGAGNVTEGKYKEYKALRGRTKMQGVGPAQLTWWAFQDRADERGGCWQPQANISVGFDILAGHVKTFGTRKGLAVYNGGTRNSNFHYADQVLARRNDWRLRLRGA